MKLEPANIVCPACGNGNYMRHLIGKNVGYLNMKCINCNSYFNFDELYKRRIREVLEPKPVTNADRIRNMTDEELAEWLNDMQGYSFSCGLIEARISEYPNRYNAWLEWLKKEVKDV